MLKITTRTEPAKTTLELEGKVAGPWVAELEDSWEQAVISHHIVRVVLNAVTFIDAKGKELLTRMHDSGAELAAEGCLTKAIVEEITRRQHR
jgi:hypothetical protein